MTAGVAINASFWEAKCFYMTFRPQSHIVVTIRLGTTLDWADHIHRLLVGAGGRRHGRKELI